MIENVFINLKRCFFLNFRSLFLVKIINFNLPHNSFYTKMLSFSKLFSKNISLASQKFSGIHLIIFSIHMNIILFYEILAVRYLYSKKYLGIDDFERYSEEIQAKESQNLGITLYFY